MLDNPARWGGMPIDVILPVFVGWGIFMLLDMPILGIPISITFGWFYSKVKNAGLLRMVLRVMYWYLPYEISVIRGVSGHMRKLHMRGKKND